MQKGFEVLKVKAPEKVAFDEVLEIGNGVCFTYTTCKVVDGKGQEVKLELCGEVKGFQVEAHRFGTSSLKVLVELSAVSLKELRGTQSFRAADLSPMEVSVHLLTKLPF